MRRASPYVCGLVLAAGGSRRLGRRKQLLPYGERTLLDHTLGIARACGFGQLLCVIGGEAAAVREAVDLRGVEVVVNQHFGEGVWKLLDRRAGEVVDVPVAGSIPRDVDTWDDYHAVLAEASAA